jgi:putative ABC transport system permease protein
MLRNYFMIACRNLLRNKSFSVINISGLAIGMASAVLVLLWVQNEITYDSSYENSDRLYQLWNTDKSSNGLHSWNNTPKIAGPTLKKEYPEVEASTRMNWDATFLMTVGEKKQNINGTMVDPDFLTMFRFPFIKGDMQTALNDPNNIVITEVAAEKLFGKEDPMGKIILLDNKHNFRVSGVMKDLPNNTQFNFQYLLPWSFMKTIQQDDSSWGRNSTHNFVLLRKHADLIAFNTKIKDFVRGHEGGSNKTKQSFLYPVSKLRLYSNFENGEPVGGRIENVKIFTLIAIFILLIACINFMNMSTARSEKRAKEVGIRKVAGAKRGSLVMQFLGESILIAMLSGMIALLLVQLALPAFNALTLKHIFLDYTNINFWLLYIGFVLFSGCIAGSYPAFFLSSFRPVAVLKGTFKKVNALVTPRKALVVLQFTFAIAMIVCTIIIQKQVKYAQDRQTGYDKSNLMYVFLTGDMQKNYELIKNDLIQKGIALSVSKNSAPLTESWSSGGADWPGRDMNERTEFNYFNADGDIVKTAGLQLIEGRDIDLKKFPSDSNAVLLNEASVAAMKMKQPLGQLINKNDAGTFAWHVVGVVKDFILQSPYEKVRPLIIQGPSASWQNLLHIKLNPANPMKKNIAGMSDVFKEYNPLYPFNYQFVDEAYEKKFGDEKTAGTLAAFFAGLTIIISCLGLFGLAAYMAENRIKEIGVRKVLGASISSIAVLLSKDFITLVLIAICIATPVSQWAMNEWLLKYDYHINISWWIFAAAGSGAILIALFTVSFQSIKAAMANPVKSLRSE